MEFSVISTAAQRSGEIPKFDREISPIVEMTNYSPIVYTCKLNEIPCHFDRSAAEWRNLRKIFTFEYNR